MYLFYTVNTGEQVALWQKDGDYEIIEGPKRILTAFRHVEPLQPFIAKPNEYLVVQRNDGVTHHVKGPAKQFFDPVVHANIQIRQAIEIDASEALVVYNDAGGVVTRNIIRGPALHYPQANEWHHAFSWHGSQGAQHETKVPSALRFTKLRTVPDQMYYRVEDVRTQDEAILNVRLMLFFELVDIKQMLDVTHDPIADFINAMTADVMDFVADKTFEQFKHHTTQLNELETYTQLLDRAQRMGYRINKVAYRGYIANPTLQAMHDNAIETRTRLALEAETEAQEQQLADLRQTREIERNEKLRQEADAAAEHQRRLNQLEHAEVMRQQAEERGAELKHQEAVNQLEVKHEQETNAEKLRVYEGMKAVGIDLTQVLVAEHRAPDKLIRIDGREDTRVHLHEN